MSRPIGYPREPCERAVGMIAEVRPDHPSEVQGTRVVIPGVSASRRRMSLAFCLLLAVATSACGALRLSEGEWRSSDLGVVLVLSDDGNATIEALPSDRPPGLGCNLSDYSEYGQVSGHGEWTRFDTTISVTIDQTSVLGGRTFSFHPMPTDQGGYDRLRYYPCGIDTGPAIILDKVVESS